MRRRSLTWGKQNKTGVLAIVVGTVGLYTVGKIAHGQTVSGDRTAAQRQITANPASKVLLENGADVNAKDKKGITALMFCAESDVKNNFAWELLDEGSRP